MHGMSLEFLIGVFNAVRNGNERNGVRIKGRKKREK